jgi:hypothetical protein
MQDMAAKLDAEHDDLKRQLLQQQLQADLDEYKSTAQQKLDLDLAHAKTAHDIKLANIKEEGDAQQRLLDRLRASEDTMLSTTIFNNPWAKSALAAMRNAPDVMQYGNAASNAPRSMMGMGNVTAAPIPVQVTVSVQHGQLGPEIDAQITNNINTFAQALHHAIGYQR